MLQESLGGGGESAASAKKALTQAQKLAQLASVRPNALTLREYREGLEECLKPEGTTVMKVLGFQLAGTAPGCSTNEVWKLVLEAVVTELGSSENPLALAAAIPVLGLVPIPLVLGFLLSPEREPMNKLRTILTHENIDVRCRSIEMLSKLTLDIAINVANDGLFVFPFESHEARIYCQQDVETLVNDCWKLIFHTLSFDGQSQSAAWAAGTAFTALANLFARCSTMTSFFPSSQESIRVQAPIDDVASGIYKHAFPRIRVLVAVARALPTKQQPDAVLWISMLLYTMMERSGARCPSVSVPYVEIDADDNNAEGADEDDDEPHSSTEPVRVDELVSDLLESWVFPTISRRVSLEQASSMCHAIFILLAHPLQTFTRMRWAAQLANHLIAQCYLVNKRSSNSNGAERKLELSVMLVKTFAWLSGVNCQSLFVRTTEAIYLVDQEKDRRDLVQSLMDTVAAHIVANRDFQLLQGLCTMTFFRQPKGFSRLSPRTNGSEVFRALFQSLSNTSELLSLPRRGAIEQQISQLIALRVFRGLLLLKLGGSATTSPKVYRRSCEMSANIVYYTGLLTSHFQGMLAYPELALRESLDFFQQELFPTMDQIASQSARLQILWIGVRLHRNYAAQVPFEVLVRALQHETGRLFTAMWHDDDEMEGATFDNGLLGCGGTGEDTPANRKRAGDANNVDALMVLGDCITLLAQFQPNTRPQFIQMCENLATALSDSGSSPAAPSQQYRIVEDVVALLSAPSATDSSSSPEDTHSKEIFDPQYVFLPRKHLNDTDHPELLHDEEYREPVTVTGSADPVSVRISHRHPLSEKEEVISLEVSCCNLTTWPLSDLEIHLRPLGGVGVIQCVDSSKDLKLRLLRAGETVSVGTSGGSTTLPPFGVIKAEKRFRMYKFTQGRFLVQAVLVQEPSQDSEDVGGNPPEDVSPTPIRLAFSNQYVVHFDTLLRLPQSQFTTAAFFQHCWQSANASALWRTKAQKLHEVELSVCQHALHYMNPKIAAVPELQLELPMHFHIAMLTQTRWGSYVVASLTMSNSSSSSSEWMGVLEVRSTRDNIREFEKWPQDTTRLFAGKMVQICSAPAVAPLTARDSVNASDQASNTVGAASPAPVPPTPIDNAFSTAPATAFAPDVRSTTSFHKDVSMKSSDRKASFTRSQPSEQVRAPETPAPDDQWGSFL